jgi:hypothetical protein
MHKRAEPSGITLAEDDAALIKGMLRRGDRQHDIAAWFGVNGDRIAEIAAGNRFAEVAPGPRDRLPPPGPYPKPAKRVAVIEALVVAKEALTAAEHVIRMYAA